METVYEFMNNHMSFLQGSVGSVIFWLGELTLLGCLVYGWRMFNAMEKAEDTE